MALLIYFHQSFATFCEHFEWRGDRREVCPAFRLAGLVSASGYAAVPFLSGTTFPAGGWSRYAAHASMSFLRF